MPAIIQAEVLTKFSVAAAAGNTTAGTAATSLGDQISTTAWAGGVLHDLFDVISGAENAASTVDFRCLFATHTNAANIYENAVVYVSAQTVAVMPLPLWFRHRLNRQQQSWHKLCRKICLGPFNYLRNPPSTRFNCRRSAVPSHSQHNINS